MENYKRWTNLLRDMAHEEAIKYSAQVETYQDIYMQIESMPSTQELWTYLALEEEKAKNHIAEYGSYEKWLTSRAKLAAIKQAEKWLKKLEANGG